MKLKIFKNIVEVLTKYNNLNDIIVYMIIHQIKKKRHFV